MSEIEEILEILKDHNNKIKELREKEHSALAPEGEIIAISIFNETIARFKTFAKMGLTEFKHEIDCNKYHYKLWKYIHFFVNKKLKEAGFCDIRTGRDRSHSGTDYYVIYANLPKEMVLKDQYTDPYEAL